VEVTHAIFDFVGILSPDMTPHGTENQLGTPDTLRIVVHQKEVSYLFYGLFVASSGVGVGKDVVLVVTRNPKNFFVALA
jgi:hypothetical protein